LCQGRGISDATFYKWKAKYGGPEFSQVLRIKTLEKRKRVTNATRPELPGWLESATDG